MKEELQFNDVSINIIKDDLTLLDVDAFVFYARQDLALGSGYGNAISTRGGPSIKKELDELKKPDIGDAVVTEAGLLKAKKIIHAVGPAFQEENIEKKLETTVKNALKAAESNNIQTIAFPLMGAGFYGIAPDLSIKIMYNSIKDHLKNKTGLKEVIICANDNREFRFFDNQKDIFK